MEITEVPKDGSRLMVRTETWLTALVLSVFAQVGVAQNTPFRATLGAPVVPAQPEGAKLPPTLPPFPIVPAQAQGGKLPPVLPTTPPFPVMPVTPPPVDRIGAIPNFFGGFYANALLA